MPDQSQSYARSGNAGEPGNPSDTSANHPEAATPQSVASNVTVASEGEKAQADQAINQDPTVSTGDVQTAGTENATGAGNAGDGAADEYDDEDKWPYRALQHEAKQRDLDASGKREEIVARLREHSASGSGSGGSGDVNQAANPHQGDSSQNLSGPTVDPKADDYTPPSGDASSVENGGIRRSARALTHSEILEGLAAERREQQLAAVKEQNERRLAASGAGADDDD